MAKILLWVALAVAAFAPLGAKEKGILFNQSDLDDLMVSYSSEEREKVLKDYAVIEGICFTGKTARGHAPRYVATAGAPGARKSTILEHVLREDDHFAQAIYLDPDQRALKWMVHTFYATTLTADALSQSPSYAQLQQRAYDKWRPASNYIANTLLEKALQGKYDIAHGTTMTGPYVSHLLTLVKDRGYQITLLLCGCEDHVREEAITYRNEVQGFYQTDPKDVFMKGRLFPKRMPLYFQSADELRLYWSEGFNQKERLAAVLTHQGVSIEDQEAYDAFRAKYERDRQMLAREEKLDLPKWKDLVKNWRGQ